MNLLAKSFTKEKLINFDNTYGVNYENTERELLPFKNEDVTIKVSEEILKVIESSIELTATPWIEGLKYRTLRFPLLGNSKVTFSCE